MSDYKHLLVTTDFSHQALAGVSEAAHLAALLGSRLTLLYVVEDTVPALVLVAANLDREALLDRHRERAEEALATYAGKHIPDSEAEVLVRVGSPVPTILAVAGEQQADLIVMSSHGHGAIRHALFGSTTERVLHHASCPVLVVRSQEP